MFSTRAVLGQQAASENGMRQALGILSDPVHAAHFNNFVFVFGSDTWEVPQIH